MSDEAPFQDWVGRSETIKEVVSAHRVEGLCALLDHKSAPHTLPPLGHWMFMRGPVRQSDIGEDGHPKRGGASLFPPLDLPRRMWAGSRVEFLSPIPVGAAIACRSTLASITAKSGRSGQMVFIAVDHEIVHDGAVAIRERQDLVYREAPPKGAQAAAPPSDDLPEARTSRAVTADPVQLFRYSALTSNTHRIHYDADYVRDVEGYRGLVVHGPYGSTLMLDDFCTRNPRATLKSFSFRARSPLFVDEPFTLNSAGETLWLRDRDGAACMTAEVGFVED